MTLISVNPYSGKIIKEYKAYDVLQLDEILGKAEQAYSLWKNTSFQERAGFFLKCKEVLLKNKSAYGNLISSEMGKPIKEALAEIEKCAAACEYFALQAENLLKPEFIKTEATESYLSFEPIGTVLAVMPWNFPFWQVFRFAIPTLMAGNTALLKHAPNVCGCALVIEKIFELAEFPKSVFQTVLIENETTEYLINHRIVKAVSLTGSEKAGVSVASIAGRNIKKCVLELGGSDPFIVLPDADLEHTVQQAVKARLQNNGQSCIAAKRFILHESIAEEFISKLTKKVSQLNIGDPSDSSVDLGTLARSDMTDTLSAQVIKSIEKGAKAIYTHEQKNAGAVFTPVILLQVKPGMPAYEEELFGPVFSVIEYKTEEQAIQIANDTRYGLGASIWTTNLEKGKTLASKIESGTVFINEFVKSDSRLPFGGIKKSGYGRELSGPGIKEFVNVKTVYVK